MQEFGSRSHRFVTVVISIHNGFVQNSSQNLLGQGVQAMGKSVLLAVLVVLSAWIVLFFAIRHWGPGRVRRRVRCPDKHLSARLTVHYTEADFGGIRASDVAACSLLPGAPVNCDKECLTRL